MGDSSVGRLKGFAVTALKLGVSITMAFVAFAAICAVVYWAYTYPERQQAKASEAVRNWSTDLSSNLGLKLRARTKVADGRMHSALEFDGYPEFLKLPSNRSRGFNLEWKDADGFTRIHKFVPVSEFTIKVNDKGKPDGLTGDFAEYVSIADYSAVAGLEVGWTFDTETPQERPAAPQPAAAALTDHCAPGLTRQERLRRLAQHGSLRETGYNTFSAGPHTVTLSGAEVIYCS